MSALSAVIDLRLAGYQRAGIATYGIRVAEAIAGLDDVDVRVLTSRWRSADLTVDGAPTIPMFTPPHHRLEQVGLAIEMAGLTADVVHFPDFVPARFTSIPTVVTVHDLAFARYPGLVTPSSARYYGQVAWAVRAARRVIAVSQSTADDLIAHFDASPDRIDVVPEAPDPLMESIPTPGTQTNPWGLRPGYLLFVGTREPRKNLAGLLAGYAAARTGFRLPPLVIAGRRGWLAEDLEGFARDLGIEDAVHFIGGVAREQMPRLYGDAMAFTLVSQYEGFGLTAMDAMAAGVPCVLSRRGALPEIAGDAALFVDPSDVRSIADAIRTIVRDHSLRLDLSRRGRSRAAQYTWARTGSETLEVYRRASA